MTFRKSLATLAAIGIFAGTALGLEKGDKMPDLTDRFATKSKIISGGIIHFYPDSKGDLGNWEYAEAVSTDTKCEYTINPFAVQSFRNMEIYIDNERDGIINSVLKNGIKKDSILKVIYKCEPLPLI